MTATSAFEYPTQAHSRRHGPMGYADYQSYRDWLRDEFSFRCVFCLRREQWGIRVGAFHLDHFVSQAVDPSLACVYENLLYVCVACNLKKGDLAVPDPSAMPFGDCLRVNSDGTIHALNAHGELLIDLLRLDDDDYTQFRKRMLDTLKTLELHDRATFTDWMRYPDDLPDLSLLKPPGGNSRLAGVVESCYAKRQRGELPSEY